MTYPTVSAAVTDPGAAGGATFIGDVIAWPIVAGGALTLADVLMIILYEGRARTTEAGETLEI